MTALFDRTAPLQASKPCKCIQKTVGRFGRGRKGFGLDLHIMISVSSRRRRGCGICIAAGPSSARHGSASSCGRRRLGRRAAAGAGIFTLIFQGFLVMGRPKLQRLDFPVQEAAGHKFHADAVFVGNQASLGNHGAAVVGDQILRLINALQVDGQPNGNFAGGRVEAQDFGIDDHVEALGRRG